MVRCRIEIRKATREDAGLIARVVAMAIGDEEALRAYCGDDYIAVLTEMARRESTQYSWQHALVAEVDGMRAGAVVGYDGERLYELREGTFSTLRDTIGRVPMVKDECDGDEYYLDSVGIMPEYRGLGVGRELVRAFCERVESESYKSVGLIVDYDNPNAARLYLSLGFEPIDTRLFFGHKMWHMQRISDVRERVRRSKRVTEFQRRVYMALIDVPRGETISYMELARRIGCKSAQAVGQALKRNPFAPEVPCHRVVASDGSLCGYNGKRSGEEIERKLLLLEQEKKSIQK